MTKHEFMNEVGIILENAKTGVLATVSGDGKPSMRWMTPAVISDRPGALYAVTSKTFGKTVELTDNPNGQWMIQTNLLDRIVTIRGKINVLDNSSIKAETLEAIGPRLHVFWRVNTDPANLVVLETVIEEGIFFQPMKGIKETISFS